MWWIAIGFWNSVNLLPVVSLMHPDPDCDEGRISRCVSPVQKIFRGSNENVAFPVFSNPELEDLCRLSDELKECLAPHRKRCTGGSWHMFDGTEAALAFLCIDGAQAYLGMRSCITEPYAERVGAACNATHHSNSYALLANKEASLDEKRHLLCEYLSVLVTCLQRAITRHCGYQQGIWMKTFKTHMVSSSYNELQCLNNTKLNATAIFGIALGMLVLLITAVVTLFVCRTGKDDKRLQRSQRATSGFSSTFNNHGNHSKLYGRESVEAVPNTETLLSVPRHTAIQSSAFQNNSIGGAADVSSVGGHHNRLSVPNQCVIHQRDLHTELYRSTSDSNSEEPAVGDMFEMEEHV